MLLKSSMYSVTNLKRPLSPFIKFFIILVYLWLTGGCGYHLIGKGGPQDSLYLITVSPLANHTSHPHLSRQVTEGLIKELTGWPSIQITNPKEAVYTLSGEILSYTSQIPYMYDNAHNPVEFKLSITMTLRLTKNKKDLPITNLKDPNQKGDTFLEKPKPMRVAQNLKEEETYRISFFDLELGQSKHAENEAMEKALERIIKRGMDQLLGTDRCY